MYHMIIMYMYICIYIWELGNNKCAPWNWFVYMLPTFTCIHKYGSATKYILCMCIILCICFDIYIYMHV